MTRHIVFQPLGRRVPAEIGSKLLDIARKEGIGISSVCGGVGTCGDCRVRVHGKTVTPLNETELDVLYPHETNDGLRLACQIEVLAGTEDIVVDIPPESLIVVQRSQVDGVEGKEQLQPGIEVFDLQASPPSIHDLRGDWERLAGDRVAHWQIDAPVLAGLPALARQHQWRVRIVVERERVIGILPPAAHPLGFAIDIGTTGLAAYLVDLITGETLAVAGATNPQIAYGEDVMSRLAVVLRDPTRALQLQHTLIHEINRLIDVLCAEASVNAAAIVAVCAVGNTAMHHLFWGLPVDHLGLAPYVPSVTSALTAPARDLGLQSAPGAIVYSPPCIAGFVGADHVAMLVASKAEDREGVVLYLDIGTNTEISLTAKGQHWCCSAASGPAFEGAHIEHGMRAAVGAVDRVTWADERLHWHTIGDAAPIGICGSGLIDTIAVLRDHEIITPIGAFQRQHPLVQREGSSGWIEVVSAAESANQQAISLRRADIGEIQMAKGAIRAGIKLLCELAEIEEMNISTVVLAGAFGTYIDPVSARTIGLIPDLPLDRIQQVGNASGIGAKHMLLNRDQRRVAQQLISQIAYVELTTHPDFKDRYSQALRLTPDLWD